MVRYLARLAALAAGVTLLAAPPSMAETFRAELRRTPYGAPHVVAKDLAGIGYGIGYASAEDNLCEFAQRMLTVRGERARWLGAGEGNANLLSDLHHRRLIQTGRLEKLLNGPATSLDTPSRDARAMARGFVAGINRYIRDTGVENLPDRRCRGAAWVRAYAETDYWRSVLAGQSPTLLIGLAGAAPPGATDLPVARSAPDRVVPEGQGSNAYAIGREMTKSGKGVLLGNPHYPWDGINRFQRMHFIIPGRMNIVGAGLINTPSIGIGHNDRVAWTHTVSTARRFGLFELKLDPADPTAYWVDGRREPMKAETVTVQVRTDEGLRPVTRTMYATRWGPVVETADYPWTAGRAFALREAPVNLRGLDQYLRMWRARSVRELAAIMSRHQSAGFNTTAVDAGGEAFYGDIGALPYVTDAKAEACSASELAKRVWLEQRVPVLDGSRSTCNWDSDPRAAVPGIYPPAMLPQLFRTDYASQSNDSYWLTNARQPLTGFGRIFGDENTARSLRTRLGLDQIERRMAGADGLGAPGFDLASVQSVLFSNRHLGGEMTRDDLVGLCRAAAARSNPELGPACQALADWDLRVDAESRGAHLFRLFAEQGGLRFKVPFDRQDPVRTPNTLDVADPRVLAALVAAVKQLNALGIPADARLADVQTEPRGAERIPIHGGPGPEGVFNVISSIELKPQQGWAKIRHGASWIMAVEFTDKGPVSQGVLTYSQSTNPDSPHSADQTRLYASEGWDDLRFTEAAVRAGTVSLKRLEEGGRRR